MTGGGLRLIYDILHNAEDWHNVRTQEPENWLLKPRIKLRVSRMRKAVVNTGQQRWVHVKEIPDLHEQIL
jgi:hypothetical protein